MTVECPVCKEEFNSQRALNAHKTVHTGPDNEDLLNALREMASNLGRTPTSTEMYEDGSYGHSIYQSRFGSWNSAVEAAGLEPNRERNIPDEKLLNHLRELHDDLERVPTSNDVREVGEYGEATYTRRFDTWNQALKAAGLEPTHERDYDEEILLKNLREMADELGRPPTVNEMTERGKYGANTYYRKWGNWDAALRAAGIETPDPRIEIDCNNCGDTVEKLRSRAEKNEYNFCSGACYNQWRRNHPEEHPLYSRIEVDCETCGESLRRKQYRVNQGQRHFCSKDCLGDFRAQQTGEEAHAWNGGYSIYYGQNWPEKRQEALQRDNHRCQACGISNEAHLEEYAQSLEVHHITPLREFEQAEDANTLDNLVTLCKSCHADYEGLPIRPDSETAESV